jgi:hypothetical protein
MPRHCRNTPGSSPSTYFSSADLSSANAFAHRRSKFATGVSQSQPDMALGYKSSLTSKVSKDAPIGEQAPAKGRPNSVSGFENRCVQVQATLVWPSDIASGFLRALSGCT